MESYHYLQHPKKIEKIRQRGTKIFLDSGAFSMFTRGVKVDLRDYAQFIIRHQDIIEVPANLDAIGNAEDTYANQKKLEGWLKPQGLGVLPVHHVRDKDYWLQRYLDEGYQHICLGGMVGESTATLRRWLDHVWHRYLTDKDGKPKVKVHGFGMTTRELLFRYPWASVDSTSWYSSRYGGCFLDVPDDDGTVRDYKIDFSSRSGKRSWHYDRLPPPHRKAISDRLEELEATRIKDPEFEAGLENRGYQPGWNPKAFAEGYGWRAHFNIHYFERLQARACR